MRAIDGIAASAMITLRTYAHLWPGDDDRTRSVMDATPDVVRTGCGPNESTTGIAAGHGAIGGPYACLVSQKILSISAIMSSSSWALPASMDPLAPVAPASLVASLNSWCSSGYFSKCGGLK